jgi:hypothetical protein
MNTINLVLLITASILVTVILYVYLNGKPLMSRKSEPLLNSFEGDVGKTRQETIKDIYDYANYNATNIDMINCSNLPNNITDDRYPQLYCSEDNYYQRARLGAQIDRYVAAEDELLTKDINSADKRLRYMGNDRNSLINKQEVIDFLDYNKANPVFTSLELFGSVPTAARPDSFANNTMMFPKNPGDFYGKYEVDIGQYELLGGLKLHLDYSYLIITDTDGLELIKYQISSIDKIQYNKMPIATVSIKFTNIYKSAAKMTDTSGNITDKQRKINLLMDIGLDGSMVYLFGNNGIFRFYNFYKNNIFKVTRLTQE